MAILGPRDLHKNFFLWIVLKHFEYSNFLFAQYRSFIEFDTFVVLLVFNLK